MSHAISRMYATHEQAAAAMAALADEDYSDIHMVSGATAAGSTDAIVAAITKGNVLKADAKIYAKGISRGQSLVTVHAPFGGAARATNILHKFHPVDSGVTEPSGRGVMEWDDATPMSCILQLPLLLDDAAPFSKFWNVPLLSRAWFSSMLGMPLLSSAAAPLSSAVGMPLLSKNAAPLSSLLNFPTLIKSSSVR